MRKQSTGKERLLAKDKSSDLGHCDEFYLLPGEDSLRFSVDVPSTTSTTATTTSASASSATLTAGSSGKKRKMPSTFVEGEELEEKEGAETAGGAAAAKPAAKKKPKVDEEPDERQQQQQQKKKVDTRPKCMYGKACYRKVTTPHTVCPQLQRTPHAQRVCVCVVCVCDGHVRSWVCDRVPAECGPPESVLARFR